MDRTANSTIKGFLYQFNLSLNEILKSNGEAVQLEGIIEDIDLISDSGLTAIQCKYHESADKFSWSKVYKPILQMLKTYTKTNGSNIKFILHAFFPKEKQEERKLTSKIIAEMLNSKNEEYICDYIAYIKRPQDKDIDNLLLKEHKTKEDKDKIVNYYSNKKIKVSSNVNEFINSKFIFRIGKSYEELETENIGLLEHAGFKKIDIEELIYPNAIHKIAELSILKDGDQRKITKDDFLGELKLIKKTAISRWTKELTNYRKLLYNRRKQLSNELNQNYIKRCLVFNPNSIENFDDYIVIFIKNFIDRYCKKTKLHNPAVFCFLGYEKVDIDDLVNRLYQKRIEVETGFRGKTFYPEAFNREPIKNLKDDCVEFKIKICGDLLDSIEAINKNKPDDIFQFSEVLPEKLSTKDVNIEVLDVNNFSQIEYLLKMKDEVEI